jgi:hypothetical protein
VIVVAHREQVGTWMAGGRLQFTRGLAFANLVVEDASGS